MLNSFLLAALLQSSTLGAGPVHVPSDKEILAPLHVTPVRSLRHRHVALAGGWNGLGGLGLQTGYDFTPHFSLDLGAGLSAHVGKVGLRARYNLLKSNVTPFVAAGFQYGFGSPSNITFRDKTDPRSFTYKVDRSPLAQGVIGISWVTRRGFMMMASGGWSQLLRKDNVLIKAGAPSRDDRRNLKLAFGSGPVADVALGYQF